VVNKGQEGAELQTGQDAGAVTELGEAVPRPESYLERELSQLFPTWTCPRMASLGTASGQFSRHF
jgi:hypothetical protein